MGCSAPLAAGRHWDRPRDRCSTRLRPSVNQALGSAREARGFTYVVSATPARAGTCGWAREFMQLARAAGSGA